MCYVYILRCNNKKLYIGCTSNLRERIERHHKGYVPATAKQLPIKLLHYFAISDKYKAYEFEKYLKSGSGRAFFKKHFLD